MMILMGSNRRWSVPTAAPFQFVILARHPSCQPPIENIFIYSWDSITNLSFSSFRFRRQLEATTANRLFKKQNKTKKKEIAEEISVESAVAAVFIFWSTEEDKTTELKAFLAADSL